MEVRKVGIVDYARSPISRAKGGALNQLSGLEIATQVVKRLLERNPKLPLDKIEMLTAGCAFPEGENGLNVARQIVVKAGLPIEVAAVTVNQFCASSQQSTMMLADAISVGKGEAGISVGLEHMTRVPMGGFNATFDKELYEKEFYISMGATAEILAKEGQISRAEQEEFSVLSHRNALKAWADGAFARDVVAIDLPDGSRVERDESPIEPNLEKIRSLAPAFDSEGTVTAATSSPVTTGAAALIVMSEELAKQLGIPLRATIVTTAVAGCDYRRMGMGPLPATEKALSRAGLKLKDIDVIELNEAFAAQSLYVMKKGGWPLEKTNLLGGAIALGHPLGMSGARVIGQAITVLEKVNGTHAIATMCVGGGQGATTVLKRERRAA
ncbi:MAG: thiolase family protein [Acidobacteria bacterium]|nr:thiolase family protein [Acidobacteriota bacterium]